MADTDVSGSRDVIGHVTIRFAIMPFPIDGPLEPVSLVASVYNGFPDIKWRM